jgi:hypothetical protein
MQDLWDPLSYLTECEETDLLDLSEIAHLGRKTKEIAKANSLVIDDSAAEMVGREVGDDRVDLCRYPGPLCAALAAQEELVMMITSPEDTGVRLGLWNFCEVTSCVPTDPTEGYDFVRKDGDFSNLGYNDSIILRIILDVQKGDGEDHSSTEPGKMSMLGSRLATPRRDVRGMWMLASMFQDAMLCTHKATEPKYLPPLMGGTGVTPLFDNSTNVFLYVLAYKGGSYRRIYATAVAEAADCLYSLERGVHTAPVLCPRLRDKQEYFWGTYDNYVFVPDTTPLESIEGVEPPLPLYTATGGANRYLNFENRLLRTRLVLTRRSAQKEWSHTRRLQAIFQSLFPALEDYARIDRDRSRIARAKYEGALSANSALQNLLRREATRDDARQMMGDAAFKTLTVGKRDFTKLDAMWVYRNGQGENFSLRDISLSEDIFVRQEVSAEETFKVSGIPLRPIDDGKPRTRFTVSRVGLYQINNAMEEWADHLLDRLLSERDRLGRPLSPHEAGPIFDQDREWVNDDSGLIAQCHRDTSGTDPRYVVALVSNDRRLANQMAETCNVPVYRIRPREYAIECYRQSLEPKDAQKALVAKAMGNRQGPTHLYVDTGSLSADAVHLVEDEDGSILKRTVTATGWNGSKRFSRVTLTKTPALLHWKAEKHRPVTRPKVWRQGSRPAESIYSSHSSWRRTHKSASSDSAWWRPGSPPSRKPSMQS